MGLSDTTRQQLRQLVEAKPVHQFKGSHFSSDDGTTYSVEAAVAFAKTNPRYFHKKFPVSKIISQLSWWDKDPSQTEEHMKTVDTSFPLLVLQDKDGSLSVADGLNRLKKATSIEHKTTVPAYVLPMADILFLGKKKSQAESTDDWHRRLTNFLNSDEAYAILGNEITSWMSGGCWLLAEALKAYLGAGAQLMAVSSSRNPVEHVVVFYRGHVIDGDGVQTPQAMLRKMATLERVPEPKLVPFTAALQQHARSEIQCPASSIPKLVALLQAKLGAP